MGVQNPNITDEVSATLNMPVSEPRRRYQSHRQPFVDGSSQTWRLAQTRTRSWRLQFQCANDDELDELHAFLDMLQGSLTPFYFDNPRTGELDIKVLVEDEESIDTSYETAGLTTVTFPVIETV